MSSATIGRWGRSLAVRMPRDVAGAAGLSEGERVEIEIRDGDILIRRPNAHALADAAAAAEEIIAESGRYSLDDVALRELLHEGRRG